MNKVLPPIRHRQSYTAAVDRIVLEYFNETLFDPLFAILEEAKVPDVRENALGSQSALERALRTGGVWFSDGTFYGAFTASVASELRRLGATFDPTERAFHIPIDRLPDNLKFAAAANLDRAKQVNASVQSFLNAAQANYAGAATGIDVDLAVRRITEDLQHQFVETVKGIDWISVEAEVTPGMREAITRDLTENLNLHVKNFLSSEIPELRQLAEQSAFAGYRSDRLAKQIEARYGVTKRKAAFLADQETSLITAKYREEQAKSIGSVAYKWSTSHDERVRHDHKALNGRTFFYDDPPITNTRTGARNNPGEDFRCRCLALPIITVPGNLNLANSKAERREFSCARTA